MQIAENFNDFATRITSAGAKALNTPAGQEWTQQLLDMKLNENPNLTPEEWEKTKQNFLTFVVLSFVKETPEAMQEMGKHVYNELRKQEA